MPQSVMIRNTVDAMPARWSPKHRPAALTTVARDGTGG